MRVEGARLLAIALSTLGHGALLGWLGAGGGEAIVPPQPIAVALVVEAPAAAPAAAPIAQPDPPAETRGPPPVEPVPPAEAAPQLPKAEAAPAATPAPAPLTKPAAPAIALAPRTADAVTDIAPAAGSGASEAPARDPAPAAASPSGAAVAALTPREAAPLAGAGNAPPVYPLAARRQGIEGRVILEVAVDERGRATGVKVAISSGSRLLDEAALKAVRDWRFTPATLGGEPIAARVKVPVTFRLDAPG
ncbi:MAG TPA: energy transducer TonB [Alphaproteobacteria bacterium]|nr:energy transducer TonB [Alphaproteobacteria bacterium]